MPRPAVTVVAVPADRPALFFPDVCVVCGTPSPDGPDAVTPPAHPGDPPGARLEAPFCRNCARQLSRYWWTRIIIGAVWVFIGALPAWLAAEVMAPWTMPMADQYGFLVAVPFLVLAVLSVGGGFALLLMSVRWWPPGYDTHEGKKEIECKFLNAQVAAAFAELNGVPVKPPK